MKIVINPLAFYFLVFSWPILGPKNAALDGEFFAKNRLAGSYTVEELAWGVCKGVFRRLPTSGTCNSHLDSHNDLIDHIFPSKSTMRNTNYLLRSNLKRFLKALLKNLFTKNASKAPGVANSLRVWDPKTSSGTFENV